MLNNVLKAVLKPLDDKRISVPLGVLLVLYSSVIAPEPPAVLENLMQNPVARLVAISLLALIMAKGNLELAGLAMVAVVLTLALANRPKVVYQIVDPAKKVVGQVRNIAEDVVEAVQDVTGLGAQEGNQLQAVQGV